MAASEVLVMVSLAVSISVETNHQSYKAVRVLELVIIEQQVVH
jgi:hypothetical protein